MPEDRGGGGWRNWQVWIALVMLLMTLGGTIFRFGGESQRLDMLTEEVNELKQEIPNDYARKDVVEQELQSIQETEHRIEDSEKQTNEALEQVLEREARK